MGLLKAIKIPKAGFYKAFSVYFGYACLKLGYTNVF